jgi:PQQ-like domain
VSSTYRAPSDVGHAKVAAGAPRSFRGDPQVDSIAQGRALFALYGRDAASARYLLALRDDRFRYSFDLESYSHPPRVAPGEREFVYEEIVWAREANGVLYVANAHLTYATSSYGQNAYITAIDPETGRRLWRSKALVSNAQTFVVTPRYLVTGYGFTAEPDWLYLLDRKTGRVVERLALPSAPERITRRGGQLIVRTYDHVLTVRLRNS